MTLYLATMLLALAAAFATVSMLSAQAELSSAPVALAFVRP